MTDSWAIYKNEEEETNDFIAHLGGKVNEWTEHESERRMVERESVQFLFFPKSKKKTSIKGEQRTGVCDG